MGITAKIFVSTGELAEKGQGLDTRCNSGISGPFMASRCAYQRVASHPTCTEMAGGIASGHVALWAECTKLPAVRSIAGWICAQRRKALARRRCWGQNPEAIGRNQHIPRALASAAAISNPVFDHDWCAIHLR